MKNILYIALAIIGLSISACQKENNPQQEIDGLQKIQAFGNDYFEVEIFTANGKLQTGYNDIYFRLKDKSNGNYVGNAVFDLAITMNMANGMSHACPFSSIEKVMGKETLFKGYAVFQMAGNANEHWALQLSTTINGQNVAASTVIDVRNAERKRVAIFTGSDAQKYILAQLAPQNPKVAVNDLTLALFKVESGTSFPKVANYKIESDPRMPAMDNHSSPNNENPVYSSADGFYHGKVSFSMTGLWKLNFILKNENNDVIYGNAVSEHEDSNLFLEIEF